MKSDTPLSPIARRVFTVTTGVSLVALVPITLTAQASIDSIAASESAASTTAASVASAVATDQPISLCIVPGSGTAYRVGVTGLPPQCLSASHTLLTLNRMGPQGAPGLVGPKGDSGAVGATGPQGEMGAVGPAGPQGAAGVDGAAGAIGPMGPAGAPGEAGAPGAIGAPGVNGINGADGVAGPAGAPGAPGAPGTNGTNGTNGADGAVGPAGAPGTNGTNGADGAVGPAGAPGTNGTNGADGAVGPAGAPGAPGTNGTNGADGAVGPAGAPGAMGPAGPQGLPGEAGTPGTSDHSALTNLTEDSHPQYLIAGERSAVNGFVVTGTVDVGATVPSGTGTRLMWNPRKAAFRAGTVEGIGADWWDDSQVGHFSAAFGLNNRASGNSSFATGYRARAEGLESFAVGNEALATGQASAAFNGQAIGYMSFAIGNMAYASGHVSLALGQQAYASGSNATAIGRSQATGERSVAIGTENEATGEQSIAIGNNARTDGHRGSVVIGAGYHDNMMGFEPPVHATAENQFVVRATGGYIFYTEPNLGAGVTLSSGGGSWNTLSDRNKKTDFRAIDGESLLSSLRRVPVTSWTYKAQDQSVRHIGPMAQDWEQAFGLSRDSTTINSGDIAGVTLAGVQALETRTSVTAQHILTLEQRVRELELQLQDVLQALKVTRENSRPE